MNKPQSPHQQKIPSLACLQELYQGFADVASSVLMRDKTIAPQMMFLQTGDCVNEPHLMSAMAPESLDAFFTTTESRAAMGRFIRQVLDFNSPEHAHVSEYAGVVVNLVVVVSEAWRVAEGLDTEGCTPAARDEAVCIQMHSERGTMVGFCPFIRGDDGVVQVSIEPLDTTVVSTGSMAIHDVAGDALDLIRQIAFKDGARAAGTFL